MDCRSEELNEILPTCSMQAVIRRGMSMRRNDENQEFPRYLEDLLSFKTQILGWLVFHSILVVKDYQGLHWFYKWMLYGLSHS